MQVRADLAVGAGGLPDDRRSTRGPVQPRATDAIRQPAAKPHAHSLDRVCVDQHHRAKDGGGFHLARTDKGWEWPPPGGRTYRRPVTRLYEPGDNYWPLNYRQVDGYDPNKPVETVNTRAPEPDLVGAATAPDLPDEPSRPG